MIRPAIGDLLVVLNIHQCSYLIKFPGSQTCRLRIFLLPTHVRAWSCKSYCSTADTLSFLIVREQQNTVAHLPSFPVQNAHTNRKSLQKQKSKLDSDMQRSPLDSRVQGSNNPRICNPDDVRLRDVSELRSCLLFCPTSSRWLIFSSATMYRALFRFATFNAMQSSCFDTVRTFFDVLEASVRVIFVHPRS